MKLLIATVTMMMLVGCGKTLVIDPDFQPLVDDFNHIADQHNGPHAENLIIEYGDSRNVSAGATCYQDFGKTPTIKVDKKTWIAMGDVSRKEMIHHEMGHCVLGRVHIQDNREDGCKVSIMAKSPVGEWCENAHGAEYEAELFEGR